MGTKFYTNNDITLEVGDLIMPITSFKFDSGKVSYINKTSIVDSPNAHNLNTNILVLESPLGASNTALTELIGSRQKVNIETDIRLLVGQTTIIDDTYDFEGYTLSSNSTQPVLSAYLYFSYAGDKSTITINGNEIPILDYAITVKNELLPQSKPNSNTISNIWLAEARAFSFNIAEDYEYEVLDTLNGHLLNNTNQPPIYNLVMILRGMRIEKNMVVEEITKESKDTANTVLRVTFLESGEI